MSSSSDVKSACRADLMYCCLKNAAAVSAHAVKLILLVIYSHYLCENLQCSSAAVQQCSHDKTTSWLTAFGKYNTLNNGKS